MSFRGVPSKVGIIGLFLLFGVAVLAEEPKHPFSGFAFWTATVQDDKKPDAGLGHAWLMWRSRFFRDDLNLFIAITPEGPPKLLHNLQLTLVKPTRFIEGITIGRTIPVFGYEAWRWRVDELPLVRYSTVVNALTVRANGVKFHSRIGSVDVFAGVFGGRHIGGNLPAYGCCETDVRVGMPIRGGLYVGGSYRSAAKDAFGADVSWKNNNTIVLAEMVSSNGSTRYGLLGEYRFTEWGSAAGQAELLEKGEKRFTFGPKFVLFGRHELKVNAVLSDRKPTRADAQFIVRW